MGFQDWEAGVAVLAVPGVCVQIVLITESFFLDTRVP